MINGFRNRDLCAIVYPEPHSIKDKRRISARVTRQFRMLRAHGLIRKIPRTHRYLLTDKGRQLTNAILQVKSIAISKLMEQAA